MFEIKFQCGKDAFCYCFYTCDYTIKTIATTKAGNLTEHLNDQDFTDDITLVSHTKLDAK